MSNHMRLLGILNIIWGSFGIFAALIVFFIFGGVLGLIGVTAGQCSDAEVALPLIGLIASLLIVLIVISSLPSMIAGIGLLRGASWARLITIIVSVLHLFHFPFGTALGIYGLWVLCLGGNRTLLPSSATNPPIDI